MAKPSKLKTFSILLAANLFILLFAEIALRAMAYFGVVPIKQFPTSDDRVLRDMNPHFGVWREENRCVRHQGACFDVDYTTNSFGMRDKERMLESDSTRHVVLGDSFVEGYGVDSTSRFTDLVEAETGTELLNFGVSGDVSSTQEYLVYRELAAKFEHEQIAIFFLPANDFRDNNPENFEPSRYRPYLRRKAKNVDEFEIYYTVPFEQRKIPRSMSAARKFRRELYNQIYLLNAIRQIGDIIENSSLKDNVTEPFKNLTDGSYDDYNEEDLKKLLWGYGNILRLAGGRPVSLFVIPREVDFINATSEEGQKLMTALEEFATHYSNLRVVDLLPLFLKKIEARGLEYSEIFLPCDGHWSPLGHQLVGEIYTEELGLAKHLETSELK